MGLVSVPQTGHSGLHHLLLQLEDTVHQSLGRWRTARNININGHDSVTPTHHRVRVMVVASTIGTRAHRNDPSRVGHLIVNLSQRRSHFVGQSAGNNHDIGLTRRRSENNTQSVLVISGSRNVHHLHGATGQTKSHGPERRLSCPHGNGIQRRQGIVDGRRSGFLRHQWQVCFHRSWGQVLGRKTHLLGGKTERLERGRCLGFHNSSGQSKHGGNGQLKESFVDRTFCEVFRTAISTYCSMVIGPPKRHGCRTRDLCRNCDLRI